MNDFKSSVNPLITRIQEYKLLILTLISISTSIWYLPVYGQMTTPTNSIKELREGSLIIRFPTYKSKIDTLTAMAGRTGDPKNKSRLEKELNKTIQERDTFLADYIEAFKTKYDFSKVAYIFDYDARNLNTADYYNLDGERIAIADLSEKPLFYLYFERTAVDAQDALVVYNRYLQKVPAPFPNDFIRGGINILFLKISNKKFPSWRVGKINKQFYKYWEDVK
ncbi:MAG: hypothetical protein SH808_08045 [Saprospiraceae bacterium]|nr:hypothetical protein [Saprospiraceae bacterium]